MTPVLRPCAHPGCDVLTFDTRCSKHRTTAPPSFTVAGFGRPIENAR